MAVDLGEEDHFYNQKLVYEKNIVYVVWRFHCIYSHVTYYVCHGSRRKTGVQLLMLLGWLSC